jgi:hypothetical protein
LPHDRHAVSGPARESGLVNARLGLLAVLTCMTLVLTALRPGLAVSLVIFLVAGACGAYRLAASAAFALRDAGRTADLWPAQRRGTRSAPGVSHREYLLPGHKTSAIRGTQDQLTRMNLPLPPAVVGGRRAITGYSTPGNRGSSVTI